MIAVSVPGMPEPDRQLALAPQLVEPERVAVERQRARQVLRRQVDEIESHAGIITRLQNHGNGIMVPMREWIPTPASAKGRLVLAALEAFGREGYAAVAVADLARAADTTTGPLYHHFESKLGLYTFVREDVERRVLDRLEGALAVGAEPAGRARRRLRLRRARGLRADAVRAAPGRPRRTRSRRCWTERLADAPRPLGAMLAAAWRAALAASADGARDDDVRAAIRALRVSPRPRPPAGS